jgi:hypothetical protein
MCIENGFMRAAENGHGLGQDQARKLRSSGMRCSVHGGNRPLAGAKHPYRGIGLPMCKLNDLFRYLCVLGAAALASHGLVIQCIDQHDAITAVKPEIVRAHDEFLRILDANPGEYLLCSGPWEDGR